jgi:hypothetical protein
VPPVVKDVIVNIFFMVFNTLLTSVFNVDHHKYLIINIFDNMIYKIAGNVADRPLTAVLRPILLYDILSFLRKCS